MREMIWSTVSVRFRLATLRLTMLRKCTEPAPKTKIVCKLPSREAK